MAGNHWERELRDKLKRLAGPDTDWLQDATRALHKEPEMYKRMILEETEDGEARKLVQKVIDSATGGDQAGVAAGAGVGRLLTLEQVVAQRLSPLTYTWELSSNTIESCQAHKPKAVQRWEGFQLGVEELVASLPDTPSSFKPFKAPSSSSANEAVTIHLLLNHHFAYLEALGGEESGLPCIAYGWPRYTGGIKNAAGELIRPKSRLDNGWIWTNPPWGGAELIVVGKAKQAFSRPFVQGWGLVDEYLRKDAAGGALSSVEMQLQQLCGQMLNDGVQYGLLYSDRGFWFTQYDRVADVLFVSQCFAPDQSPPLTLVAAILHHGKRAADALVGSAARDGSRFSSAGDGNDGDGDGSSGCSTATPRLARRAMLDAVPTPDSALALAAANDATCAPECVEAVASNNNGASVLQLGPLLGHGITGSVYDALLPGSSQPVAIKVAEGYAYSCLALAREVSAYQQLAGLQGEVVPRLLVTGVMLLSSCQRPFLALPQLGPSLEDYEQPLLPEQEQAVLQGLARIHAAGVLHGDVREANVLLPHMEGKGRMGGSGMNAGRPMWVDFANAEVCDGDASCFRAASLELGQCHKMIQELRSRHGPRPSLTPPSAVRSAQWRKIRAPLRLSHSRPGLQSGRL